MIDKNNLKVEIMKDEKITSKQRDYRLIVNGKFNLTAIMQKAWAYMKNYGRYYTLRQALKESWIDARMKMDEYKAEIAFRENCEPLFPHKNLAVSDFYSDPLGNLAMGYVTK